ncbi:hypothetical protein ACHAXR_000592, partial [Thalassiosira sp. AJA248-18]
SAFAGCKSLRSIKFPSTVTEVDKYAFAFCTSLRDMGLNEGLRKIGVRAFCSCTLLEIINFPSTIIEVGVGAFSCCDSLRIGVLNEGLRKIGEGAFRHCRALESINFSSTVTEVGDDAFHGCTRLRYVVLNEGIQKIGERAFDFCGSLETFKFPSTVTEVGGLAFCGCDNLQEVVLNEGVQKIGQRAFASCHSLENITFPCISRRIESLNQNGQTAIENKINATPGVVYRRGRIVVSLESVVGGENWETTRERLDTIFGLMTYYELKEATAIFDLALTRAMISVEVASVDERDASRIEVPGPVKAAVLQFFSYNRDR